MDSSSVERSPSDNVVELKAFEMLSVILGASHKVCGVVESVLYNLPFLLHATPTSFFDSIHLLITY
jgi:hypothetical protein